MGSWRTGARARAALALLLLALACLWCTAARSEAAIVRDLPVGLHVPDAAKPGPNFDVDRATEAWLGLLSPEQRQLSDAYFEGGYWLQLWDALYSVVALALLLWAGLSRRMRDFAERAVRWRFVQTMIYAAVFLVAFYLLKFPLTVYAGFWREHEYGLSNLTFGGWFKEEMIGLALLVIIGSVALGLLYVALRRTGARWWMWATGLVLVLFLFTALLTPVFIAPLYNDYKPLAEGPVRDAVYSLARANEVPTDHVAWFDNSRQTTRVSANVSGVFGVTRISLNDNLLEKTSLPEIKAVLGHEMGHYVLNHIYVGSVHLTLLYGIALWIAHGAFDRALARWGPRLGLRGRDDPAALPLMAAILVVVLFILTPFSNSLVRTAESEADAFGLNVAREPEGFAMVSMRLSTYRKLKPGPIEEFMFYDHPSGYERVRRAMLWRKENLPAGG
jgi:Zn-dependent protease with chaperone function